MLRFATSGAVICVLSLSMRAMAASAFVNGGFESGDFSGWTVGGNAISGVATDGMPITDTEISDNAVAVRTGSFAAFAKLQSNTPATLLTLEQTVDVDPGVNYSITVRRNVVGSGTYRWTNDFKIFLDGVQRATSGGGFSVGPGWSAVAIGGWIFPVGKLTATFRLEFGGYATDTGGLAGFSIDDVSIQPIPEPTGLAIASLLGLAWVGRRRRLSNG